MKKGDKITIKNHPECALADCEVDEYQLNGRVFLHAVNRAKHILLAITSPDGEPWDIVTLRTENDIVNHYEATWRRQRILISQFKEEI